HNTVRPEAFNQSARGSEDTAQLAHVEAENHDPRIALHLVGEGVVDGLDDVSLRHCQPPLPSTSSALCRSTRGGGSLYTLANTSSGRVAAAPAACVIAFSFSPRSSSVHSASRLASHMPNPAR